MGWVGESETGHGLQLLRQPPSQLISTQLNHPVPPLSPPFPTTPQPDLRHVYAASNDPVEHGPGGKGKPGTVYTLSEAEYKAHFPGPWTKPSRVPFETGGWGEGLMMWWWDRRECIVSPFLVCV